VLFVLRVDSKTEKSEVAPFEEVKEQLRDQVFGEKLVDAEEEWYQRARREAAINVLLKVD
jgi:parvulin-like peptidyl-prolyl isomerase